MFHILRWFPTCKGLSYYAIQELSHPWVSSLSAPLTLRVLTESGKGQKYSYRFPTPSPIPNYANNQSAFEFCLVRWSWRYWWDAQISFEWSARDDIAKRNGNRRIVGLDPSLIGTLRAPSIFPDIRPDLGTAQERSAVLRLCIANESSLRVNCRRAADAWITRRSWSASNA